MPRLAALVPKLPRSAWIVLTGDLLSAIGTGLSLPFLIIYLHRVRGIDLGVAGLIVATIGLAALAGNPLSGALIDRIGARRTVLVGLVVAAAGTAAIAFVTEPWQGFAATGVSGFGVAVVFPSFDSLLAVAVRPEQRSSAFAVRHATMNLGLGLGSLIAAGIVNFGSTASFQALFLLDGLSFLALAPCSLRSAASATGLIRRRIERSGAIARCSRTGSSCALSA